MGHVFVLLGSISYLFHSLGLFFGQRTGAFWYRETYTFVVLTFGYILYGDYASGQLNISNPASLLQDTTVQYLLCSLLWLLTPPYVGTLPPFVIFSFSHVVNYTSSYLLPLLGYPPSSPLIQSMQSFITNNSTRFLFAAANIEFIILLRLIFHLFTFTKLAFIRFAVFLVFFKLRYQTSAFTHKVIQLWEIKIDNILSNPSVPYSVKEGWVTAKTYIRKGFGSFLGGPATATGAPTPTTSGSYDGKKQR